MVNVTLVKWTFQTVGHQILLLWPYYGMKMVIKVKVISRSKSFWDEGHSRIELSVSISIPKWVVGLRPNVSSFLKRQYKYDPCIEMLFLVYNMEILCGTSLTKISPFAILPISLYNCQSFTFMCQNFYSELIWCFISLWL